MARLRETIQNHFISILVAFSCGACTLDAEFSGQGDNLQFGSLDQHTPDGAQLTLDIDGPGIATIVAKQTLFPQQTTRNPQSFDGILNPDIGATFNFNVHPPGTPIIDMQPNLGQANSSFAQANDNKLEFSIDTNSLSLSGIRPLAPYQSLQLHDSNIQVPAGVPSGLLILEAPNGAISNSIFIDSYVARRFDIVGAQSDVLDDVGTMYIHHTQGVSYLYFAGRMDVGQYALKRINLETHEVEILTGISPGQAEELTKFHLREDGQLAAIFRDGNNSSIYTFDPAQTNLESEDFQFVHLRINLPFPGVIEQLIEIPVPPVVPGAPPIFHTFALINFDNLEQAIVRTSGGTNEFVYDSSLLGTSPSGSGEYHIKELFDNGQGQLCIIAFHDPGDTDRRLLCINADASPNTPPTPFAHHARPARDIRSIVTFPGSGYSVYMAAREDTSYYRLMKTTTVNQAQVISHAITDVDDLFVVSVNGISDAIYFSGREGTEYGIYSYTPETDLILRIRTSSNPIKIEDMKSFGRRVLFVSAEPETKLHSYDPDARVMVQLSNINPLGSDIADHPNITTGNKHFCVLARFNDIAGGSADPYCYNRIEQP